MPSLLRIALITALALCLAAPTFGYIVFLKDGSQVQAKEKIRIEGDKAYVTLPSGTVSVLDAAEVDIAKTEEINKVSYGTATLIEGREQKQLPSGVQFEDEKETLADLARRRQLTSPEAAPPAEVEEVDPSKLLERTRAGYLDLAAFPRRDYHSENIRVEIVRYMTGQGVDKTTIFEGTRTSRPLVEIVVNSEATVFQALKESATILEQLLDRFPQEVTGLELYMITEGQNRAGQFILDAENAKMLTSGALSPENFFLRYVEF